MNLLFEIIKKMKYISLSQALGLFEYCCGFKNLLRQFVFFFCLIVYRLSYAVIFFKSNLIY